MAGVPTVLVRCHIADDAIRGRLQKMHLLIPVQIVDGHIMVRESDARRFADSKPGSTLAVRKWLKRYAERESKTVDIEKLTQGLRSDEIAAVLEEIDRKRKRHNKRANPVLSNFTNVNFDSRKETDSDGD